MNRKKTKSALLSSVLALVLCFTMLLSTTFAWFTDSVTSTNNIIKSGNLDIELEYATEFDADGNVTKWETVNGSDKLFDENALWEPGYTQVVYLKMSNLGTLALKYQLGINIVNETTGTNVKDETFKLSESIYMGVVENQNTAFANRDAAVAAVAGSGIISTGYTKSGEMLAGADDIYLALVVYMPETVENEANYKTGTTPPQITLGVNLFATQLEAEFDSFGNDYDGGAQWLGGVNTDWYFEDPEADEFTISSSEELAGLAALVNGTAVAPVTTYAAQTATTVQDSFTGKTIKLTNNLNLNNLNWTPIGNWDNAFGGTFDGQGYTISNLYINDTDENTGSGVGLFGVAQNATIKGIKVHNADVTGYEMVATIVGSPYSGCTVSDCHVTGNVKLVSEWAYVGGIVGYGYTKVNDCSVIADGTGVIKSETRNAVGGIAAWLLEDASSIKNCQVKNLELTGWANIGAITGFMHRLGVIDSCSAENVVMTKTREDGHPTIGLAAGGWSYNASKAITVTNNTFKNITLNGTYLAIESADILYGAEYAGSTSSNFVTENNVQENITNNLIEVKVIKTAEELEEAFTNGGTYALANKVGTEDWTLALTETVTVPSGVEVVLYMNGKSVAGTLSGTGNQDLFLVKGDLTIKNGSVELSVTQNQGWGAMSSIFDITAGGVVNLENVIAENKGGTDMNFAVHMNNWGEVTLNVTDSLLKATYCPVRVFNSGPDMNNVTIKNSTLESDGSMAFWVHNYTSADFGGKLYSAAAAEYDEAKVLERMNFDFYDNGNTFTATNENPIRYGFNNAIRFSAEGVKSVTVSTQDALNSTVASGDVNVTLSAGEYTMPTTDGDVTISGTEDTVISGNDATAENVTFNGVTIQSTGAAYTGIKHSEKVVYNDVTIVGNMYLYAENVEFNDCTFDLSATNDYIWVYGATNVTFTNCTFNTMGKALLVFQDGSTVDQTVKVEGCTFNASESKTTWDGIHVAAVSIDGQNGGTYNVILNNNTVDSDFNGLWQDKTGAGNITVTVDGTTVLTPSV